MTTDKREAQLRRMVDDPESEAPSRADLLWLLEQLAAMKRRVEAAEHLAKAVREDQQSTGPFKPSAHTLQMERVFRAAEEPKP